MRRFEDVNSFLKDEIDGVYIRVKPGTDSIETASGHQRDPGGQCTRTQAT